MQKLDINHIERIKSDLIRRRNVYVTEQNISRLYVLQIICEHVFCIIKRNVGDLVSVMTSVINFIRII